MNAEHIHQLRRTGDLAVCSIASFLSFVKYNGPLLFFKTLKFERAEVDAAWLCNDFDVMDI